VVPTASPLRTLRPEAQEGGPIALLQSGDQIAIDAELNVLHVYLSEDELAARRARWRMPPYKAERGTLAKYIRLVKSASLGCVTEE
jgi:dihydroxy-acid dehydratase